MSMIDILHMNHQEFIVDTMFSDAFFSDEDDDKINNRSSSNTNNHVKDEQAPLFSPWTPIGTTSPWGLNHKTTRGFASTVLYQPQEQSAAPLPPLPPERHQEQEQPFEINEMEWPPLTPPATLEEENNDVPPTVILIPFEFEDDVSVLNDDPDEDDDQVLPQPTYDVLVTFFQGIDDSDHIVEEKRDDDYPPIENYQQEHEPLHIPYNHFSPGQVW